MNDKKPDIPLFLTIDPHTPNGQRAPKEFLTIDGQRGEYPATFRNPVTAPAGQLLAQAPDTADIFLDAAVQLIDGRFGPGYAERHPELIGAHMQTAASAYQITRLTQVIQEAAVMVADTICGQSEEIRQELDHFNNEFEKLAEVLK